MKARALLRKRTRLRSDLRALWNSDWSARLRKIAVIVNPASGGSEAPLRELNEALATFESTIQVTQTADDGMRFCREAVSEGVDLIIVYGGDGTISQVLDGLDGSEIPLLILRGGTGNLIADELNLPVGVPETLALFADGEAWARPVDLGMINQTTCFVLRCGCGLEVRALQETVHEGKSDWGKLAYAGGLLKALSGQEPIDFRIWIDDATEPIEESGIALTVANAGRIGAGTLQISPTVSMSDGSARCLPHRKGRSQDRSGVVPSNHPGTTHLPRAWRRPRSSGCRKRGEFASRPARRWSSRRTAMS